MAYQPRDPRPTHSHSDTAGPCRSVCNDRLTIFLGHVCTAMSGTYAQQCPPQHKRASPLAEGDISFPLIAAGRRGLFVIFRRGRRGRSRTDPKAPRCLISSLSPPPGATRHPTHQHYKLVKAPETRHDRHPPFKNFCVMSASAAHDVNHHGTQSVVPPCRSRQRLGGEVEA